MIVANLLPQNKQEETNLYIIHNKWAGEELRAGSTVFISEC